MSEDSVTKTTCCKISIVDILCRIQYSNKKLRLDRVEDLEFCYNNKKGHLARVEDCEFWTESVTQREYSY